MNNIKTFTMISTLVITLPPLLILWYFTIVGLKEMPFWISKDILIVSIFFTIMVIGFNLLLLLYLF